MGADYTSFVSIVQIFPLFANVLSHTQPCAENLDFNFQFEMKKTVIGQHYTKATDFGFQNGEDIYLTEFVL